MARRIAKELRRAAATLAAPFAGGLHEKRRLKRAPKTCLVKPPREYGFVRYLEF